VAPRGAAGRLLLASLTWARGSGPDLVPLARAVRRWGPLLDAAWAWGVRETLAHAAIASGADAAAPPDARAALHAAHAEGAASNLALLAEAARLQALLDRAGIPSVALKGTALVAAHYPVPAARHVGDLDLLVPRARLADAVAALAPEGTGAAAHLDHEGHDAGFPAHVDAIRTAAGVCVELHFAAPGDASGALAGEILADARRVSVAGGRALVIPQPVHCAAVACLHALAGHEGQPGHLPRLVADLEALDATAGLDWARIAAAAGAEGAPWIARAQALLERARAGELAAPFPGPLDVLAADLAVPFLRSAAASPRAALRTFLPSRRFMAARYGVPERSPRLLLYYVARPFLAVRDRLRR
jgi:hypothetical protein